MPEGWAWIRLKDVIDLLSGRDLPSDGYQSEKGAFPYITGASNFDKGNLSVNRWTDTPEVISEKQDVLLTCKGTIGEIAINTIGPLHIARQIMALRPTIAINNVFLANALQSMIIWIKSEANGLIPGISRDVILKLLFPLPPVQEQARIIKAISQYKSILKSLRG